MAQRLAASSSLSAAGFIGHSRCSVPVRSLSGLSREQSARHLKQQPRLPAARPARTRLVTQARYTGGGRGGSLAPEFTDRLLAAVPYILPFFNAYMYGRFLFYLYPVVKAVMAPILPAIAAFHSVPFASFIAFFALYLGVVNNTNFSRFVRFNAMQAALLDIVLVLPRLVETVLSVPTSGWGLKAYVYAQGFVWIFITVWVVYGVANALLGSYARIPFIGEAAEQQIR